MDTTAPQSTVSQQLFVQSYQGKFLLFGRPEEATARTYWMYITGLEGDTILGGQGEGQQVIERDFAMVHDQVRRGAYTLYDTYDALSAILRDGAGEARQPQQHAMAMARDEADLIAQNTVSAPDNAPSATRQATQAVEQLRAATGPQPVFAEDVEVLAADAPAVPQPQVSSPPPSQQLATQTAVRADRFESDAAPQLQRPGQNWASEEPADLFERFAPQEDAVEFVSSATRPALPTEPPAHDSPAPRSSISVQTAPVTAGMSRPVSQQNTTASGQASNTSIKPAATIAFHPAAAPQQSVQPTASSSVVASVPAEEDVPRAAQPQKVYSGFSMVEEAERIWQAYPPDLRGRKLAQQLTGDLDVFAKTHFGHFADETEKLMYGWQMLAIHAPEALREAPVFQQFEEQYGDAALVKHINSKPH